MSEILLPPEAIASATLVNAELPHQRSVKKENADTTEVKIIPLSPEDQQLAALPDELAEIIFAKLAQKGISAL